MTMRSEQNRLSEQERRKRWGGCFPCFRSQKGGKRIVPSSRVLEGNPSATQQNGPQASGLTNRATAMAPSLLAPPSSPASFTNSALPSTAPSPNCFLSLSENSPGATTMFAAGPYAHETQLVSPPVFSTFTTEPSTAPLTPPPELAHLTTQSSPDVPFAQFLSSSLDLKGGSGKLFGVEKIGAPPMEARDSNFFCPATFAQFYLDPPLPHTGGRLSVSKDSDINSATANGYQNRQNKAPKQDVEELEAYRASFGFSADEIEITDVADDSFTITPFASTKLPTERRLQSVAYTGAETQSELNSIKNHGSNKIWFLSDPDRKLDDISASSNPGNYYNKIEEEDAFSKLGSSQTGRKYPKGLLSCSDAEVDYGRVRSFKGCNEGHGGAETQSETLLPFSDGLVFVLSIYA